MGVRWWTDILIPQIPQEREILVARRGSRGAKVSVFFENQAVCEGFMKGCWLNEQDHTSPVV